MPCLPARDLSDYDYTNRANAMENSYSNNHSYKLGNIVVHILCVADVDYQFIYDCSKVLDTFIESKSSNAEPRFSLY